MAIPLRSRIAGAEAGIAFGLRLVLTLVATLAAIGAAQYMFTGSRVVERAVAQEIARYRNDAAWIEQTHQSRRSDWDGVHDVIGGMAHRSDVHMARLITASGVVAAVGVSSDVATGDTAWRAWLVDEARRPMIDAVVSTGEATAQPEPSEHLGDLVFHLPVALGDDRFVLEVIANDDVIAARQHDFNAQIVTTLAVGVLLGVPIFYVAGGRGLNRRHATAVRHSSRDELTGLGNHRGFQEQLRREVEMASRHGHALALAVIDLDGFKMVNDTYGHRIGDEVLAEVGSVLRSGRPDDQGFRVGGDEFALLLPSTELAGARAACERLREQVERANRGVTVSVGLSELGVGGADAEALWKCADVALYEAKRAGCNRVMAFCDMDQERAAVSSASTAAVQRLLAEGRMGVAFQPIWDLGAQALLGFEALARPPAEGLSSPLQMFDAADQLGRVAEVDDLCRRAIFDSVSDLPDGALLFVNVAPTSLAHELSAAERLAAVAADGRAGRRSAGGRRSSAAERLAAMVDNAGLSPDRVVLELTERTVARRSVIVRETAKLRAMGFKIAIDDVGAGNSGLELMRQVPVDFVKIDRSVVVAAVEDTAARGVLMAIVAFAHETGAFVIAEGIEHGEQLSFLRRLPDGDGHARQIRGAQGYLLGRPGELTATLAAPLHATSST